MGRKAKHEEHENHERWLVSYADFITLLFAFFVVMYSVSSVNEGKYRVLSESLDAAFRSPNRSIVPIQIGDIQRAPKVSNISVTPPTVRVGLSNMPAPRFSETKSTSDKVSKGLNKSNNTAKKMEHISKQLVRAMGPLVEKGLIDISKNEKWVKVNINSSILFSSGSANLSRQSLPVLESIAKVLKSMDVSIHVEGFTDNVPIKNIIFPSNWELSAARAASVVHLFSKSGIDSKRMAAIGYGEYHPVADNNTAEGRKKNRRVVLIINSAKSPRLEDQENMKSTEVKNTKTAKSNVVPSKPTPTPKSPTGQSEKYKTKVNVKRKTDQSKPNFIQLPRLPTGY